MNTTESWRDDYEPGMHPSVLHAIHQRAAQRRVVWPFPPTPNPKDKSQSKRPPFNPANHEDSPL